MTFKPHEIDFMRQADLGRLATIQSNGTPQNSPVGFTYNERPRHHRHRRLSDVEEPEVPQHRARTTRWRSSSTTSRHATRGGCGAWRSAAPPSRPGRAVASARRATNSTRRSSGSRRAASSASASTTATPSRTCSRRTRATSRRSPALHRQRGHRAGFVDRQVRQHRRGQAAGPFVQPAEQPSPPRRSPARCRARARRSPRASATCDSPKAAACSSRPHAARTPPRRRCPARPGTPPPPPTPCRSGCAAAASAPGLGQVAVGHRRRAPAGRAVVAATPTRHRRRRRPAPSRRPRHSAGGRSPSGARVTATSAAPSDGVQRIPNAAGSRGATKPLQPTSAAASQRAARILLAAHSVFGTVGRSVFSSATRTRSVSSAVQPSGGATAAQPSSTSRRSCGHARRAHRAALVMSALDLPERHDRIPAHRRRAVPSRRFDEPIRPGEQQIRRPPDDRVGRVLQEQHPGALPRRLGDRWRCPRRRWPGRTAPCARCRSAARTSGVPGSRRTIRPLHSGLALRRAHPQHRGEAHPRDVGQPAERALPRHRAEALAVEHQLGPPVRRQLLPAVVDRCRSAAGRTPSTSAGRRGTKSSSADRNTARRRARCRRCTSSRCARAATGLTQPVPVVGMITSSLRSKAPVRSSSRTQDVHPGLVGVGGLQAGVDPDGLLGGLSVEPGQLVGVRAGGHEVAALVAQGVPRRERRWAAGPFGFRRAG